MQSEVVAIWRDAIRGPKGYKNLGMFIIDMTQDRFFTLYAHPDWLKTVSHEQKVKAMCKTIENELLKMK